VASKRDYYEVLGVPRDAERKAIKEAFRRLAKRYHPDRNKAPDAEEKFKEIAEAYAVLYDPKKRAAYDAGGHAGVAGVTPDDLFGGVHFEDLFADLGADLGGFGLFDRLFRRGAGPHHGADIRVELFVPLAKIAAGGEELVRVARETPCAKCKGNGAAPGTKPRACKTCGGSGRLTQSRMRGDVSIQQITTCPGCHGAGSLIDKPCPDCRGTGTTHKEEKLTVRIPVGAEEGMALRVPGHGHPSPAAGGSPGDLYVVVRSEADPRFERHGANLWRPMPIEVVDAVLGCKVKVPTLDGEVEVEVPPGTQPDAVLRLKGKGLPCFGAGGHGDLLLRVAVRVPDRLSKEQRALYEQLRGGGSAKKTR
jgi:molecular chaperone DnaJ